MLRSLLTRAVVLLVALVGLRCDTTRSSIDTQSVADAAPVPTLAAPRTDGTYIVVHDDGSIDFHSGGITPDVSWIVWTTGHDPKTASVGALSVGLCAAERCDLLWETMPDLPFDGGAFTVRVPARRMLLTRAPKGSGLSEWIDCAVVVCEVVVVRVAVQAGLDGTVGVATHVVARLPYILPNTAPGSRPRMSLDAGPHGVGRATEVVLTELPPGFEHRRTEVDQCAISRQVEPDPRGLGCRGHRVEWAHEAATRTIRTHVSLLPCDDPIGCVLAVYPCKDCPPLAVTAPFTIDAT